MKYSIFTDAVSQTVTADSADEAAAKFAADNRIAYANNVETLRAFIIGLGGFGSMTDEDGKVYFRVK